MQAVRDVEGVVQAVRDVEWVVQAVRDVVSECDGDCTPRTLCARSCRYVHDNDAHCHHKTLVQAMRSACVDFGTRAGCRRFLIFVSTVLRTEEDLVHLYRAALESDPKDLVHLYWAALESDPKDLVHLYRAALESDPKDLVHLYRAALESDPKDLVHLFRAALESDRKDLEFIEDTLLSARVHQFTLDKSTLAKSVITACSHAGRFDLVGNKLDSLDFGCTSSSERHGGSELFRFVVMKAATSGTTRCHCPLAAWLEARLCERRYRCTFTFRRESGSAASGAGLLVDLCLRGENSWPNVALYAAAVSQDWTLVARVLAADSRSARLVPWVKMDILHAAIREAGVFVTCDSMRGAVSALIDQLDNTQVEKCLSACSGWKAAPTVDGLTECLLEGGHLKWAVFVRAVRHQWQQVTELLADCRDVEVTDYALDMASWQRGNDCLVDDLLTKCSGRRTRLLFRLLEDALLQADVGRADKVFALIDPSRVRTQSGDRMYSVLSNVYWVIQACRQTGRDGKAEGRSVALACIRAGLSAYHTRWEESQRPQENLFHDVLALGCPSIAELLLSSGAVSSAKLQAALTDGGLRRALERAGDVRTLRFLRQAGTAPRSLLELSRQSVNQRLASGPGREGRVQSLPCPGLLKDFIAFR